MKEPEPFRSPERLTKPPRRSSYLPTAHSISENSSDFHFPSSSSSAKLTHAHTFQFSSAEPVFRSGDQLCSPGLSEAPSGTPVKAPAGVWSPDARPRFLRLL